MNPERAWQPIQWKRWLAGLAASSILLNVNILDIVWMDGRNEEKDNLAMGIHTILVIFGAILGAMVADNFGRKNALLMMLIFVIPRTVYFVTNAKEPFGINTFFLNVGSGITCTLVPLYISEIASNTNCGNLMVMQLLAALYGGIAIAITSIVRGRLHYHRNHDVMGFSLLAASTAFHAVILSAFPETPQYLNWKKTYRRAVHSLAFFSGIKNVKISENSIANASINRGVHGWRGKMKEIFGAEHRRSIAMIFSLIIIKWANGMRRDELIINRMLGYGRYLTADYPALIFFTIIFIYGIFLMLTIDIFERKLSLLSVVLVNFIAIIIETTPLANYSSVFFAICCIQYFGNLIYIAATLSYVGKFFPVNVRAAATALAISFEVLCRYSFYCIESMLARPQRKNFYLQYVCVVSGTYIAAFFLILVLFPKKNKVSSSDIVLEASADIL